MSQIEPIILYGHWAGPNPYKVQIILEELDLPYKHESVEFEDMKKSPFVDMNPNGRVPAMKDPNTGVVLWESCAIIEYLVDQYDKADKLSYSSSPEKYQIQQWLFYQASGQGPYYGQAVWFMVLHPEKVPTAIERYVKEIERVRGVLNTHLQDREWLVGDKCTVADLSWAMWENVVELLVQRGAVKFEKEYPNFDRWFKALKERKTVEKAFGMRAKGIEEHNLIEQLEKERAEKGVEGGT